MRFSRLRLTGFKSFVDPTDLVIADGLTGVVGPNGCGKSNLLEALRWVMGETRAKAMRGDGMEDVIFAGSASRPARNFAEVVIHLDNADRLAPAGFNDADQLDITRRITRDAGSAYKVGGKEVRARDVQMLFADASTGAHSPSLVRQGQIAELINARPKARRRVLEEAAGISGLYQRRHEAELKLRGAESNLTRVDDVIDQLAQQLAQLARQAKQAARYRQIGEELRRAEGLLLWRRWTEADQAQEAAETALRECTSEASRAEAAARAASEARSEAEDALPACREEDAIAAAILQRLGVQRDTIAEQESAARERIATLEARIDQLARDMEREAGLNRDAGESIARLDQEAADLAEADDGHDARLAAAVEAAQEAARSLEAREAELGRMTEDTARLSARHQSAQRLIDDTRKTLQRSEAEAERSRSAQAEAHEAVQEAETRQAEARAAEAAASAEAEAAEAALVAADAARAAAQTSEAEARAARSEAESEAGALKAEAAALSRVVARDTVKRADHRPDRCHARP